MITLVYRTCFALHLPASPCFQCRHWTKASMTLNISKSYKLAFPFLSTSHRQNTFWGFYRYILSDSILVRYPMSNTTPHDVLTPTGFPGFHKNPDKRKIKDYVLVLIEGFCRLRVPDQESIPRFMTRLNLRSVRWSWRVVLALTNLAGINFVGITCPRKRTRNVNESELGKGGLLERSGTYRKEMGWEEQKKCGVQINAFEEFL